MQNNAPDSVYIGIDLGTTNSAIAWGGRDKLRNRLNVHIISIKRKVATHHNDRRELLPSVIYYEPNRTEVVGDYAKTMLGTDPECVAKSMKCYMDRSTDIFGSPGAPWTPIQVSISILRHLKEGAAHLFSCINFPNVVITVPASFKMEMRDATLKAAISEFKITKDNLLEEPIAALHYFCNKPHPANIKLDESKILVFDLGGGTLDVSLHVVTKGKDSLTIKGIAVSPYKQFGGDQFDEKVTDILLSKYDCLVKLNDLEKDLLKRQFQSYAEIAKIKLSDQINGIPPITNPHHEIAAQPCLKAHSSLPLFKYNLIWCEYKKIIEPFLANGLDLTSPYCSSRGNNIIDPILQVLDKAQKKLDCSDRPAVDIVLLNGGMTKLPIIEARLEKFFGPKVVRVKNPDRAVALGAVYYQLRDDANDF